jgi:DNA-binding beta-propeller fold protein YncE
MEARKPELDLKATCAVGGRPGAVHVSPDGSRLYVIDQAAPGVTVVGTAGWQVLESFSLQLPWGSEPFFLGAFEETLFLGGMRDKVAFMDAASRRYTGAIPCVGDACELQVIPELRQAVLTTATGDAGTIELLSLSPPANLGRLELPMPPVRGTLALLPSRGLGAVIVRDVERGEEGVVLFELRAESEPCILRMEGGVRSLAFEGEGRYLYAACHDDSALSVIDVRDERVVEQVLLAGEPYGLVADPAGRKVWALCERLGHVAYVDPSTQMVVRRTQLAGLVAGPRRVAFSPEGRLAVVPESGEGCLALIDTGAGPAGPGELLDRLELGREVGEMLWSPLGDELFVTSPECASILKIGVDRGDQDIKDTDVYLMEMLLRREDPAGPKYPLFPP